MGANQNSSTKLGLCSKSSRRPSLRLDQDRIAIDKLSALETGLGIAAGTQNSAS
jgi:hypothetical protein